MQKLKALNQKEKKELLALIKNQFGCDFKTSYMFFINQDDNVYVSNGTILNINLDRLKIDSLGLYFGELKKGMLRLSIEGSQMVGKIAKKNVLELNNEEMRLWLKGINLEKETDFEGFVIIKNGSDFLGCGKVMKKEDSKTTILNYVPKTRRILASD